MKKAERIFYNTYRECKNYIEWNGFKKEVGFNGLIIEDDDTLSTRTFNDIQKIIEKRFYEIQEFKKFEIIDEETYKNRMKILWMVQKTLENSIKNEKEFKEMLKAI